MNEVMANKKLYELRRAASDHPKNHPLAQVYTAARDLFKMGDYGTVTKLCNVMLGRFA